MRSDCRQNHFFIKSGLQSQILQIMVYIKLYANVSARNISVRCFKCTDEELAEQSACCIKQIQSFGWNNSY